MSKCFFISVPNTWLMDTSLHRHSEVLFIKTSSCNTADIVMPSANENLPVALERHKVHRLQWIVVTVNMLVEPAQQTFMILQTLRTQMSLSQCYTVAVDAVPSRTQHTASCNAEQGKVHES